MFLLLESSNNETGLHPVSDEGVDEIKSINHSGFVEMTFVSFAIAEGQLPFQPRASLAKKTASLGMAG